MRKMSSENRIREVVYVAMCAVLTAVCAWIAIPTVVPFTLQTFAVFFSFCFLGGLRGAAAMGAYVLFGLIGLPVFAGGTAGAGVALGPTGGYMLGWIAAGLVWAALDRVLPNKPWRRAVLILISLLIMYAVGTLWFVFVYAESTGQTGLWAALVLCVFPFVLPDLAKAFLAWYIAGRVKRAVGNLIFPRPANAAQMKEDGK